MESDSRELKREIQGDRHKKRTEPMWFYDEIGESEEWQTFREEASPVEREYLEIRVALQEAEAALQAEPENETLQVRVKYLQKRQAGLERQAPWLSMESPVEVLLWGVPHG